MRLSGLLAASALLLLLAAAANAAHFCGDDNCFELLKLKRGAKKSDIRRSYRKLSQTMHPDKRPGVKGAVEQFRAIGTAYELLTDDARRAEYEDYLDNPGKYIHLIPPKEYYAPKTNTGFVIVVLLGVVTLAHWLSLNHQYASSQERTRESREFQREVARLVKTKVAASKEEAEGMINLVGPEPPTWKDIFIVKLAYMPMDAAKYVVWSAKWTVMYKVFKRELSEADKMYLIEKNLDLPAEEWEATTDEEKKEFVEKKLWVEKEAKEYKRLQRIALNKAGKLKKKKKHTPMPYAEVEEVQM